MKWYYFILIIVGILILAGGIMYRQELISFGNINKEKANVMAESKIYNEVDKEVTILSGTNTLANVKLNTPLVNYVIRGKDRLVAEFTISNLNEASNVFNGLRLIDLSTKQEIQREVKYKYKVITYETWGSEDRFCKDEEKLIGCEYKPRNFTVEKINWYNFNDKAILQKGNITIGLFTDVYANEGIEWVQNLYGIEINEWAVWNESLNVGLVRYWALNQSSGTMGLDSVNAKDLNLSSNWTTGLIGNSFSYDAEGHPQNATPWGSLNSSDGSMTINFWTNKTGLWAAPGVDDRDIISGTYKSNENGDWNLQTIDSNLYIRMQFFVSPYLNTSNNVPIPVKGTTPYISPNWFMVTLRFNSTTMWLYVNGTTGGVYFKADVVNANLQPWNLFMRNTATQTIRNGKFDEFSVWNRTLSDAEVTQLYNNGAGITYNSTFTGGAANCWSKTNNILTIPSGCVYQLNTGETYQI